MAKQLEAVDPSNVDRRDMYLAYALAVSKDTPEERTARESSVLSMMEDYHSMVRRYESQVWNLLRSPVASAQNDVDAMRALLARLVVSRDDQERCGRMLRIIQFETEYSQRVAKPASKSDDSAQNPFKNGTFGQVAFLGPGMFGKNMDDFVFNYAAKDKVGTDVPQTGMPARRATGQTRVTEINDDDEDVTTAADLQLVMSRKEARTV